MIFDTHCHLYADQLINNVDNIIKRANDAGVFNMLVLGDKIETSDKCIEIAEKYNGVYCAIGIFPCECYELNVEETMDLLRKMYKKRLFYRRFLNDAHWAVADNYCGLTIAMLFQTEHRLSFPYLLFPYL